MCLTSCCDACACACHNKWQAVPANAKNGLQVSPKAARMANPRQLRWEVSRLDAGTKGAFRATFSPDNANEASGGASVYGGGAPAAAFDATCIAQFEEFCGPSKIFWSDIVRSHIGERKLNRQYQDRKMHVAWHCNCKAGQAMI